MKEIFKSIGKGLHIKKKNIQLWVFFGGEGGFSECKIQCVV